MSAVSASQVGNSSDTKDDIVSILYNHFGDKDDSNPFEPTPISEEAIIVPDSQGQVFRLRETSS